MSIRPVYEEDDVIYLFEKLEEKQDIKLWIETQLDMLFNSFLAKKNRLPQFFGINIFDLNLDDIKESIEKEEPRIKVLSIKFIENDILELTIMLNGDEYEFRRNF